MVPTIGAAVVLVATNEGIFPVPLAARPIAVLLFVQLKIAVGVPVKLTGAVLAKAQTTWFGGVFTVGGTQVKLKVTVLSVLVDAVLPTGLTVPVAAFAGTVAITVPLAVIPDTATLYVVGPPVTTFVVAPAVPPKVTPAAVKPVTGSLNTTVKLIGETEVGSP